MNWELRVNCTLIPSSHDKCVADVVFVTQMSVNTTFEK